MLFRSVKLGLPPGEAVVFYTGGVDARKNLDVLLLGFRELLHREKAVLLITGTQVVPPDLSDRIKQLGLVRRVIFSGHLSGGEIQLLYRSIAGCAISVSLYEGFGRSAIEAKMSGLPFVSSDIPSVREMVGEYARYCDHFNPVDIGEKLHQALKTQRRETQTGVEERFSLERNVAMLSEVIKRILEHGA